MKEIIETSKGRFVVKELKYVQLDSNYIKLPKITSKEAYEITGKKLIQKMIYSDYSNHKE